MSYSIKKINEIEIKPIDVKQYKTEEIKGY